MFAVLIICSAIVNLYEEIYESRMLDEVKKRGREKERI
jgi:hypothetical protein